MTKVKNKTKKKIDSSQSDDSESNDSAIDQSIFKGFEFTAKSVMALQQAISSFDIKKVVQDSKAVEFVKPKGNDKIQYEPIKAISKDRKLSTTLNPSKVT